MSILNKLLTSLLASLFLFFTPINTKGETLEIVFENFAKNAERATDILQKKEASNESLSYLRADLFEDRNRALFLQRKINDKYLIQKIHDLHNLREYHL